MNSGSCKATLNFHSHTQDGSPPYLYLTSKRSPPEGQPRCNIVTKAVEVTVRDLRGLEDKFSTDRNGFQTAAIDWKHLENAAGTAAHPAHVHFDWDNQTLVTDTVHPLATAALRNAFPSAASVQVIGTCIPRSSDPSHKLSPISSKLLVHPACAVHIDQSHASGIAIGQRFMPPHLVGKLRFQVVNVWIPLSDTVVDYPLALCDSRSVSEDAIVPVKTFLIARDGENCRVRHADEMEWWYWSGMKRGEALLIKCFDSQLLCDDLDANQSRDGDPGCVDGHCTEGEGCRVRCPHTAFRDPRIPAVSEYTGPFRRSVEVRCVVIG
ncbi:hypothetical protein HDU78_008422 [Chytriomyces hyalinus]|nr:hypothetical protein HDU78_008422 [Chytriomyces hyalinus]